jgi:hypothetical protein
LAERRLLFEVDFLPAVVLAIDKTSERRSFPLQKRHKRRFFGGAKKTLLPVLPELLTDGQASERRGQDSNLRTSFPVTGLANPRFRPLSHLSLILNRERGPRVATLTRGVSEPEPGDFLADA